MNFGEETPNMISCKIDNEDKEIMSKRPINSSGFLENC